MDNVDIPLIFVHSNNKYYLDLVLNQAYYFNKNTTIHLLGDGANNKYDFVNHHFIADYFKTAGEFEKVYQHMSSNMYSYELFCFQRWFVINDFVKINNLKHFLCLDSDVLLFCNVAEVFSEYINYDFTICETHCPCYTLFSSETLDKFCSFLMELYNNSFYLDILLRRYNQIIENNEIGGISDMSAFYLYQKHISSNVKELTEIENNKCFDGNINDYTCFEKDGNNRKRIYWENNRPYFIKKDTQEKVFAKGLHFQGNAKLDIYNSLVDKNRQRGFLFRLKIYLSKGYISSWNRKRKLKSKRSK